MTITNLTDQAMNTSSGVAPPNPSVTLWVTNTNDSGSGSLRQAIEDHYNATGVNNIIGFNFSSGSAPYTINLTSMLGGPTPTSGSLDIRGLGALNLTIRSTGNFTGIVSMFFNDHNLLTVSDVTIGPIQNTSAFYNQGGTLTLNNCLIKNVTNSDSGAVHNTTHQSSQAYLNINNCTFYQNSSKYYGGVIQNIGIAQIYNSTLSNTTSSLINGNGGAISNNSGSTLLLESCTFVDNNDNYNTYNPTDLYNDGAIYIGNCIFHTTPNMDSYYGAGTVSLLTGTSITNNLIRFQLQQAVNSWATANVYATSLLGFCDPEIKRNGGGNLTHKLLQNSLAIGAGSAIASNSSPINGLDQRGFARSSTAPSCGAYEHLAKPIPIVGTNDNNILFTSPTLVINGTGFDPIALNNYIDFPNNNAVATVTSATATTLTVTFSNAPSLGNLNIRVESFGNLNAAPVQVATVTL